MPADEVRAGVWMVDPETGEWADVKQAGHGNVCTGFGAQPTWHLSLRKFGARALRLGEPVAVRVPTVT